MSSKFPGGFITKNYVAPTPAAAPGIWTLDQQLQAQKTGTWPFGGPFNYIEDVFSTYLYTGNDAIQIINNGINLADKGGLVWIKGRDSTFNHALHDTVRGSAYMLSSNTTDAQSNQGLGNIRSFNTDGFTLGSNGLVNAPVGKTYASWTFRKQPKFFDVVTYTGDGTNNRSIAHSLGATPGCIIVKNITNAQSWLVYHQSLGVGNYIRLNATDASTVEAAAFPSVSSTSFIPTANQTTFNLNTSGDTFVAYLYAHNAGGFGTTGTDNVISCGAFTVDGTGSATVNLGFEPQWILYKPSNRVVNWTVTDTMRGWHPQTTVNPRLVPNTSAAETTSNDLGVSSTGFYSLNNLSAGDTIIYVAIRRGPMKVPTDGTKVFAPVAYSTSSTSVVNSGFPTDMAIAYYRTASGNSGATSDRLRGSNVTLFTPSTGAEVAIAGWSNYNTSMSGVEVTAGSSWANGSSFIWWNFRRAPGFFDEVCYTGDYAGNPQIPHNLGVVPELIIAKNRGATATQWYIHHSALGASEVVYFTSDPVQAGDLWTRTSTYWKNASANYPTGEAHVAYLFASAPGVSKVGSYTGTGTTQVINCGFTAGSRFILIKRTDASGDWYVWDSARGIVAGNDPYLLLNSTAAEVTTTDYVDTAATGFEISSTAPAAINASGGTFIFLAIA